MHQQLFSITHRVNAEVTPLLSVSVLLHLVHVAFHLSPAVVNPLYANSTTAGTVVPAEPDGEITTLCWLSSGSGNVSSLLSVIVLSHIYCLATFSLYC